MLDALENLPEEAPCQVAFSELQGEVPCVPDQPSACLESAHQRADDADRPEHPDDAYALAHVGISPQGRAPAPQAWSHPTTGGTVGGVRGTVNPLIAHKFPEQALGVRT